MRHPWFFYYDLILDDFFAGDIDRAEAAARMMEVRNAEEEDREPQFVVEQESADLL